MTDKQTVTEPKKSSPANKKAPAHTKKAVAKKTPDVQKQQNKPGSAIAWLAIILVVAATAAGSFVFLQLQQQVSDLSSLTNNIQQDSQQLSQKIQSDTSQLNTKLSAQLQDLQQSSTEKFDLLKKQVGKNRRQWLIAEAEYLSSLANTRLQLAGDVNTAIIALQSADQRLKENGDPVTFAVREQLAKEINLLKSTDIPDTVGISSQLIALESAVAKMGVSEPYAGTAQAPEIGKGEPSPIPENIQQTLNDAWSNFSKLVVVRRSDKPIAALMTPEQVELIRKNLALKLEAARLALINKDETLYVASIDISINWLSDYFDANKSTVKAAIEQLSTLKNTPIKAQLPSIALSLKMLRDLPLLTMVEPVTAKVEKIIDIAPPANKANAATEGNSSLTPEVESTTSKDVNSTP